MKTILGFLVCFGALGSGLAAWGAAGPAAKKPPARPASGESPRKGKVLVLENEHTMKGDIERVGDQYRVRRLVGETWVPASVVLRLCGSLEEALGVLRERANLNDPDERLRLSEWCQQHGLRAQARDEVREAVELRPDHPGYRRLLASLEQMARAKPEPSPREREKPVPPVDVTTDSLALFTTKVQPILMNTCACCHTAGRGGNFRLERAYDIGPGNRRTTQQNLAAVLAQLNTSAPQVSPLLTKAVSMHARGMSQPPLRGRQAPPYRTLEEWVRVTLANNPQLRGSDRPAERADFVPAPATPANWGEDRAARPPAPSASAPLAPPAPAATAKPTAPTGTAPAPAPAPKPAGTPSKPATAGPPDPVDPDGFNRQFHPARTEAPKPPG